MTKQLNNTLTALKSPKLRLIILDNEILVASEVPNKLILKAKWKIVR